MTTDDRTRAIAWFEKQSKCLAMPGAAKMFGLAAEALNAGRWIPVSERLPEQPPDYFKNGHWWMVSGEDFIVADSDGKVYEAHWTYGCSCQRYFWYVNSLTPLKNITHWMPLPDPPRKDDEA